MMKRALTACAFAALLVFVAAGIPFAHDTSASTATSFDPQGSLAPLGILAQGSVTVSFNPANTTYVFSFSQNGTTVRQYEIDVSDPAIQKGLLKVKEVITNAYPLIEAGPRYRKLNSVLLTPAQFANQASTILSHSLAGNILTLRFVQTLEGNTTQFRYDIELKGNALVVRAVAENPSPSHLGNYQGFSLGKMEGVANPRETIIPFMEFAPVISGGAPVFFATSYIDFTKSGSNAAPLREGPTLLSSTSFLSSYATQYVPNENNIAYPSLGETAYVTVSNEVKDVFMGIHRSPSAHRSLLNDRVVWDIWGAVPATLATRFAGLKSMLDIAKGLRINDLAVVAHIWQRYGFDCGLPTHFPANPLYGGNQGFAEVGAVAAAYGYLFAAHENYYDMYPNSPDWNTSVLGKDNSGAFVQAWNNTYCVSPASVDPQFPSTYQSYLIATDKRLGFSTAQSPLIKNTFQTTAAFHDVVTSVTFRSLIDYASGNSNSRTLRDGFSNTIALMNYARAVHQGPVLGEGVALPGRVTTLFSGVVDGVEREIQEREFSALIPDFELAVVKPLSANHGMGYASRWIGDGTAGYHLATIDPAAFNVDKYNAMSIAYGHAGFMQDIPLLNPPGSSAPEPTIIPFWIKTYHLYRTLQPQYLGSEATMVRYRNSSGTLVPLGQAISEQINFKQAQLYEEYASGLKTYINFHPTNNWSVDAGGTTYVLPPYGWVAWNPSLNYLNYSALVGGRRIDYVRSNQYLMADPRGVATVFPGYSGSFTANLFTVVHPDGWSFTVTSDGTLAFPDTEAPQVSLLPLASSELSGTVTLRATASDNQGILGVRFIVDGSDFGAEDAAVPYEISWNTALVGNGVHTLRARARDSAGNTALSPLLTVTTSNATIEPPPILPAPTNLSVTALTPTSIRLTWNDNSTNETGFTLEHSTNGSQFTAVNTFAPNTTQFTYNGLVPGSIHYYRLRAFNAAGTSLYSNVASVTLPNSSAPEAFTITLERGTEHPQVRLLQQFLARDSSLYPQGIVSGYFGALTEAAIRRFQTRQGISATGIVDTLTRQKLNALYTVTPPQGNVFTINLSRGITHPQVRLLQEFLAKSASLYPEGIISGYFGALTETAVKRFQVQQNIVTSGTPSTTGYGAVGPKTRQKLNTLYAP